MERNNASAAPAVVESVDRALRLLGTLGTNGPLGVVELARGIGVAPSTTHRLLATLAARDYVVQLADRRYDAGPALLAPGISRRGGTVAEVVRPFLDQLLETCGETCHVLVRSGAEVTFVDGVESAQGLRVTSRTGMTMPAWTTSGGKAMLAELDIEDVRALLGPDGGAGPRSRVRVADLEQEVARIRHRRYGLNENESESGVTAIGASIGRVAGQHVALTMSMPSVRATPELTARLATAVVAVADRARTALAGDAAG
ncbi:IclR family transcriptional regulator [Georgenia sp. Z1491]|uniref:IclR family transcriptional regulator n=1 Tax=Georgenia sp. Z1491 TaxID=3416707 RepID=UPI003CE99DE6